MSKQRTTGTFKSWTWGASINSPASPFSSVEKHVALTLEKFMSPQGDSCWPAMETLAEHGSRSVSTVRDALRRLTEFGWLERELRGGRGKSNRYVAVIPEYFDREETHEENHRRAVGFSNGALEAASVQALPSAQEKTTGVRRVSEPGAEGETRRSASLNPPESVVKPAGVRHQLDQDQSKDLSTLPPSELGEEEFGAEYAIRLALSAVVRSGPKTKPERSEWDRAVAHLVEAGATPAEIAERWAAWPFSLPPTPGSIVRHWGYLGGLVALSVDTNGDPRAAIDAWLENAGWRLDPDDARLLLEDRHVPAAEIEQLLARAAAIREAYAAGDAATRQAMTEAAAA